MIYFKNKNVLKLFLDISPNNSEKKLVEKIKNNSKRLKSINLFSTRWCSKYRILFQTKNDIIYIFSLAKREKVYKNNLMNINLNANINWIKLNKEDKWKIN